MSSRWHGPLAILLAAILSHAPALAAGFIWLDHAHLQQGLALAKLSQLETLFTRGFAGTGYYRPLMAVSLSIDWALGGAPALMHGVNLAWHAGAALAVSVAAQALGLSRRAAWGAGLLFAVHPVTSVVASAIAFRSEAMLTALSFAALTLHLRGHAWGSALALAAAALTKETGLVLGPLMLVLLELTGTRGRTAISPAARRKLWLLEAGALALAGGLRLAYAPAFRAEYPDLSLNEALGTRLSALTKSLRVLVLPIDVGVCDDFGVYSLGAPTALLGLALAGGLAYLAYRRRGPALLLLLALLPSMQLVPVMRWWSPHYLYLPLAFACMLLTESLEQRAQPLLRWVRPAALALAGLSLLASQRFVSDQTLWSWEAARAPGCREAQFYLAEVAREGGRLEEAAIRYQRALSPPAFELSYVDRTAALQNLGVTRLLQGRFDAAEQVFREALVLGGDERTQQQLGHNLKAAELLRAAAARP